MLTPGQTLDKLAVHLGRAVCALGKLYDCTFIPIALEPSPSPFWTNFQVLMQGIKHRLLRKWHAHHLDPHKACGWLHNRASRHGAGSPVHAHHQCSVRQACAGQPGAAGRFSCSTAAHAAAPRDEACPPCSTTGEPAFFCIICCFSKMLSGFSSCPVSLCLFGLSSKKVGCSLQADAHAQGPGQIACLPCTANVVLILRCFSFECCVNWSAAGVP